MEKPNLNFIANFLQNEGDKCINFVDIMLMYIIFGAKTVPTPSNFLCT